MGRPTKEPPSPSSLVPAIVRYARARGFDVEALTWRFALPPEAAELDEINAAADAPNELLDAIAHTDPEVVLRLGSELPTRHHPLVALGVRTSATARDALALLARWSPLLHDGLEVSLEDDADGARWVARTPRRPRGLGRHVHELALVYALARLREGAGDDVRPRRVRFAHARPPNLRTLPGFFGCDDFEFGAETSAMEFTAQTLDRPMRLADSKTVATVVPLVDAGLPAAPRRSFAQRVAAQIAASLPDGGDAKTVARALHMSQRTLHRRLEQEQTRFGEVIDAVRLDRARKLLADPSLGLSDVALRLGFADLATFSRAFKRWTGRPPGQWRRS
jgi:AraC-like DNA-binding protein